MRNSSFMYPRRNSFGFGNNNRNLGGFAVPFLLGGITGAVLGNPSAYRPYPNSFYYNNYVPYYNYYYNPYYYPYY